MVKQPCGTSAAYNRHVKNREKPCDPCRKAHAAYRAAHRTRVYVNRGNLLRDATGTHRRIRALMRMGYRAEDIAAEAVPHLKSGAAWVTAVLKGQQVQESTYKAIAEAYERISHIPGPSRKTRRMANNKGWPPPAAWDDIDTDEKATGYLRPSDYKKLKNGLT